MQLIYLFLAFLVGFISAGLIVLWLKHLELQAMLNLNMELKNELLNKQEELLKLTTQLAMANSKANNLEQRFQEQKDQINVIKEQFSREFENLSNRIFEEKSAKFTQQSQLNLTNLLNPLAEKLKDFAKKVEEAYIIEGKERASLKEQISTLTKLNQQMSMEAQNLTHALKGDSKTQGNWGEMVLESILEKSGLVKNREYIVQLSLTTTEGKRYQPDVVIKLPDSKVLIIDAKVTLTAYERFMSGANEERIIALKEHILSFRNHINNLNAKNYQNLYAIKSLDFILMFIPIEAAFALAIKEDSTLFDEALRKNIVLVCPSTLLATLKTVASIWRAEKSTQNASEIASLSGEFYDRLVGFLTSMETIETALKTTQAKYNDALTKLNGNRGLIKSAAKLKELGAKTTKVLEDKWLAIEKS